MAGSQQTMADLMRDRIAHKEVERHPESRCLLPDSWREHASGVAACRAYARVAHTQLPVMVGGACAVRLKIYDNLVKRNLAITGRLGRQRKHSETVPPNDVDARVTECPVSSLT